MDALDSITTMLRVCCLQALLASTRGSLHAHTSLIILLMNTIRSQLVQVQ